MSKKGGGLVCPDHVTDFGLIPPLPTEPKKWKVFGEPGKRAHAIAFWVTLLGSLAGIGSCAIDYVDYTDPAPVVLKEPPLMQVPVPGPVIVVPFGPMQEPPPSGSKPDRPLAGPGQRGEEEESVPASVESPATVPEVPGIGAEKKEEPQVPFELLPDVPIPLPPDNVITEKTGDQAESSATPAEPPPIPGPEGGGEPFTETVEVIGRISDTCKGAQPRSDLHFPRVPADALKSRLSGTAIVCQVDVDVAGSATARCEGGSLPAYLLQRAKEEIERVSWEAARNELDEPCPGKVTVRFKFRAAEK